MIDIETLRAMLKASRDEERSLWYSSGNDAKSAAHEALQDTLKRAITNVTGEWGE